MLHMLHTEKKTRICKPEARTKLHTRRQEGYNLKQETTPKTEPIAWKNLNYTGGDTNPQGYSSSCGFTSGVCGE